MAHDSGAPDGSHKYFLVPPDTFELLVKIFEEHQRLKHHPAIELALNFEKKIERVKRNRDFRAAPKLPN
jgi:hypothetical protein